MTLIEGVGDEVTDFFIAVVIVLVGWLAWCSTNIADQPLIRTVLILHHRTRTRIAEFRANHQNIRAVSWPRNLETSEEETTEPILRNNEGTSDCTEPSAIDSNDGNSPELNRTSDVTTTEEVLIEAMDSCNNDNSNLLHRQTKVNSSDSTSTPPPACTDKSEPSKRSEQTENTEPSEQSERVEPLEPSRHTTENLSTSSSDEINIKLKFINDDQKLVTGSLKELLGDFKKRHFQPELEAQKLVRLIFNGKILQPDSQTLETCGFYNNCVVHCLVHQPRPSPISQQTSTIESSSSIYFNPQAFSDIPTAQGVSSVHNEWDLSRLLVSILILILGLAWYSRYYYAQLFTATTTLALYALTAIFTVSLFSNFFLDQDNIRNI